MSPMILKCDAGHDRLISRIAFMVEKTYICNECGRYMWVDWEETEQYDKEIELLLKHISEKDFAKEQVLDPNESAE